MKTSILYLTYDGLSDPLGQSQILPYLEGLADLGHQITVISFEKVLGSGFWVLGSKLKVIPLQYHKSPPVLSTLYDIYRLRKEVKNVLKTQQIDIIHCRSYITSLVGLWAKREFGVKFIFDMRGFWADERVEGGLWNLNNPMFRLVYKYFKKKEKQFIVESDAVISLTKNAKREISNWQFEGSNTQKNHGALVDKIHVIPTCADLDLFSFENIDKIQTDELKKKYGIGDDDYVLLYLGSLGTWYMLEEMLDFFIELKSQRSKVKAQTKFLFVTREQNEVRKAIWDRKLDEDDFIITSCARLEVPAHISICDASIFFIIPTYSKKASAATKMAEIMGMGKPVITNTGWGDVDEIINDNNGIIVKGFEEKDYQIGVSGLTDLKNADPIAIRDSVMEFFSLEKGVERFHNIYECIG